MTLRELINEVSSLGFDGNINCDALFLSALARSQRQIFGERKITRSVTFTASGTRPATRVPIIRHAPRGREIYPLCGRAYSLYLSGRGTVTVKSGDGNVSVREFFGNGVRLAGFISGEASIIFEGEYSFTAANLVTYTEAFPTVEDIPDGSGEKCYDIREAVGDFLSFATPARDHNGKLIKGARLEDGKLIVSEDFSGNITISYRRLPRVTVSSDMEADIDIPKECEILLPLLVASYVYLERDPERAAHYSALYRTILDLEAKREHEQLAIEYHDTNGWA